MICPFLSFLKSIENGRKLKEEENKKKAYPDNQNQREQDLREILEKRKLRKIAEMEMKIFAIKFRRII